MAISSSSVPASMSVYDDDGDDDDGDDDDDDHHHHHGDNNCKGGWSAAPTIRGNNASWTREP